MLARHNVLVTQSLLFEGVAASERTWLAGLANGLLNLGIMSVFLFGALANRTGFEVIFVLAGALVAASAMLLVPGALRGSTGMLFRGA
jgi:hypothetical protein